MRAAAGLLILSNFFSIAAPLAFAQTTTPIVDEVVVPASTTPDVETPAPTTNIEDLFPTPTPTTETDITPPDITSPTEETPIPETLTPTEDVAIPDTTLPEEEQLLDLESLASSGSADLPTDNPQLYTSQSDVPHLRDTMGAQIEKVALEVPPGRNGMTPDLSLQYNSRELVDGFAGYGWSVSIPYIERFNKTGSEKLYTDNYFSSSWDGELATTSTAGKYRARIDNGRFVNYTYATSSGSSSWTAYDKNGTRYRFGYTTAAQQVATSSSALVYKWMLEEIRDTNGNYIKYEYTKDSGQIYPYRITYTGNGVTDGIFTVTFASSTRPDPTTSYKEGFQVVTNNRLTEVDASINGTLVKKYVLSYTAGANGVRSLLSSIQKTGYDETAVTTVFPAETFSYSSSTPTYTSHTNRQVYNNARVVADTDGNGLPDFNIFYQDPGSVQYRYVDQDMYPNFNNTTNTIATEWWATPVGAPENYRPAEGGVRYFDANGDGKADIVKSFDDRGTVTKTYYENNSSTTTLSWTATGIATSSFPQFGIARTQGCCDVYSYGSGFFGNINGDGLVDYVVDLPNGLVAGQDAASTYLHLSTTTGWNNGNSFIPNSPLPINPAINASQLVDINADGLDDWMQSDLSGTVFCLNTGTNWEGSCNNGWNIATSTRDLRGHDRGVRFFDINADGLPDYIHSYSMPSYSYKFNGATDIEIGTYNTVYLNTGSGWATSSITLPEYIFTGHISGTSWGGETEYNEYVDWNGDGIPDSANNTSTNVKPDLLTTVTYSTGGDEKIAYGYIAATQAAANSELPYPVLVVTNRAVEDGLGNTEAHTFTYQGGKLYFPTNVIDRRLSGFKTITDTSSTSVSTTYFNQGDDVDTAAGEQTDSFAQIGKPFRDDVYDLSGNLMKRTFYHYDTTDQGGGRYFVSKTNQLTQDYDGNGTHKDAALAFTYDTATGNITQKVNWGEVTGASDGTFSDTGSDKYTTDITYAASSTSPLSLPSDETLSDQGAAKVSETRHYYDSLSLGSATSGNETKTENWKSSSAYASTTRTYNSYGLVTQQKDGNGNATTYTYDTYNLYPATTTNALSQVTGNLYNYAYGKVKQTTDPNGYVYQTTYDGLGRALEVKQPDLTTPATLVTKTAYGYFDTSLPTFVHQIDYLTSATSTQTYTYNDGLSRPIQKRTSAESGYTTKDMVYNSQSLLYKESLPYLSTGASSTAATTSANMLTTYTYDALKRVTAIANILGTTASAFDDWKTTITDPNSKTKTLTKDAYQNLVQVDEHNGASTYSTYYAYNGLGKLTGLTDALSNVRNFTYDGRGLQLTAQDLHAGGDGTYGTWTYAYDDAGNLTQTVDPKSQTINNTYDALNRVSTEDYTGSAGTEAVYTYDSCGNGVGRLCTVLVLPTATTTYSYNALGGIATSTTSITGKDYDTGYSYDRLGNITLLVHPDNGQTKYGYNAAGLVDDIQGKSSGGAFKTFISNINYSPMNQISELDYGNYATTTNTYDPNALYRLSTKKTTAGTGTKLQDMTYSYDVVNNITRIVDASNTKTAKTIDYVYDDLYRLLSASTTNATTSPNYRTTYIYDAIGNIASTSDQGAYTYGGILYANPHAVTRIATGLATTTIGYDNNGNATSSNAWKYTWDYRNRLLIAATGVATSTYRYDYAGNRIFNNDNAGKQIHYADKYHIKEAGAPTTTINMFVGDLLVGTMENRSAVSIPTYIFPDHLGSTQVTTNASSTILETTDYYPYGATRVDSGTASTSRQFIGQYFDAQPRLSYLNARYYNGDRGGFLSQDPSHLAIGNTNQLKQVTGQDQQMYLSDPQQLNSYSYARDNPIVKSDPTGRAFGIDDAVGFAGGGAVGSAVYLLSSLATQQPLSWSGAAGAFVTGGIIGWGAVNTPETLGASNAVSASIITGLLGGYYGNLTKQGIDVASGKQSGINYKEAQGAGLFTAATSGALQWLPGAKIPGLSSGSNSMNAIGKSNLTKATNGTINSISFSSGIKAAVGSQAADLYRTFAGGAVDAAKSVFTSDKKK